MNPENKLNQQKLSEILSCKKPQRGTFWSHWVTGKWFSDTKKNWCMKFSLIGSYKFVQNFSKSLGANFF